MKYENFVKAVMGIITIALFLVPMATSASVTAPTITSIASDGYINAAEKSSFNIIGTTTATTSTAVLTINISDGTHSATTTSELEAATTTYIAAVSASTMTDGTLTINIWESDGVATSSATSTTAILDSVAPTVSTVAWTDKDSSTAINAGDKIVITFSENMSTTTATSTNVNTVMGLSGSHTFGTSPTAAWTGQTILTITLGSGTTVESGDTINPTSAVTDVSGNADASSAKSITDNIGPSTPTVSVAAGTYTTAQNVALSSTYSTSIYYSKDGTTPTCGGNGVLYDNPVNVNYSFTLKAVGCDAYNNGSTVLSAEYVITGNNRTSSGGSHARNPRAATPATPAVPGVSPAIPATPSVPTKFTKDLFVGSTGEEVVKLQSFLEMAGFLIMPQGVAKGYFGNLTKSSVIKYQKAMGLPTPGRVGPMTRAILNK